MTSYSKLQSNHRWYADLAAFMVMVGIIAACLLAIVISNHLHEFLILIAIAVIIAACFMVAFANAPTEEQLNGDAS